VNSKTVFPPSLRPVGDVLKKYSLERLLKELRARQWVAYGLNKSTGELHEISHAHWLSDDAAAKYTLRNGLYDSSFRGPGPLFQMGIFHPIFVAPAEAVTQTAKRGRPPEHDWLGITIYLLWHVHFNGLPETQAELVGVMQDWFDTKGRVPAKSEMEKLAKRIFEEGRTFEAREPEK
jgi:hypothetical protein